MSLAREGKNVSVKAPCLAEKNLDDSSRLDVVEIARVPDMHRSLFPSWSG